MEPTTPSATGSLGTSAIWENPEARKVLDSMAEMFVAFDRRYDIVFVNRALAEAVQQQGREGLVGKNHWQLWPDMVGTLVEREYERAFETGIPARFEYHYERSGAWVDVTAYPAGPTMHVYFRDVTQQKQAEQQRTEREEALRSLIDAIPHIAWSSNRDASSTYLNAKWSEYTGLASMSLEDIQAAIHPDDLPHVMESMRRTREVPQPSEYELRLRRKDGEYRWHRVRTTPVESANGEPARWVGTSTDIHSERVAAEALRRGEALSRAIVGGMADAVMVLDARGEALAANAAWDAMHNGIGSEGANLGTFEETFEVTSLDGRHVPPEGWPAARALQGETAHDYVFHLLDRRTGNGFVASYSAVPVTLEGEGYVVVSAHDITDAVRTKEALEDQLRLTKSITDNADSALVMLDVNGHFTFINPAFTRITGYTEEDLQGRTVHEVVHYKYPDGRPFPIEECPIDNSYWNLQPIRGHEDVFVRKDGSLFPVVCAVEPLEKNGQTVGGVLEFRDVTREKFREQALRFLLDLAEATRPLRDPVAITELSARMLGEHLQADRCAYAEVEEDEDSFTILHDWSPRLRSTTGKYSLTAFGSLATQELRAGRTIVVRDVDRELTPEDGADTFNSIGIKGIVCCSLIKGGRLAALMAVHQSHPRDWKPEEVELIQMVVERCWSEIERARAERALVRSEERLSTILEIATIGIIVNDVAGRFVYANAPLLRMLGYTEEDVTQGRLNWSMIQAPDRLESDDEALAELRVRGVCTPYETEYIARDGRRVPVYVGAAFVPGSGGDGLLGAAFVTDLTTLKEAQHELLALNAELDQRVKDRTAELERANEEMSAFTYHVSHDLRAPLRAIVGTSRMVQEDYGEALPEQARALLDRQVAAANKLGTLIDELLKLSRLARDVAQAQDLDMTELAREVADEHAEDNERVVVEVQDGMNAKGDPRLLRLLLSNLISNALRYSPDGGTVTVGRNGEAFFVRDQGIGFDMQYANKLFMPFERLVTESQFPGTGVGLANAKRVIDHHRGRIWAESEPGKGATFFFTLGELQGA